MTYEVYGFSKPVRNVYKVHLIFLLFVFAFFFLLARSKLDSRMVPLCEGFRLAAGPRRRGCNLPSENRLLAPESSTSAVGFYDLPEMVTPSRSQRAVCERRSRLFQKEQPGRLLEEFSPSCTAGEFEEWVLMCYTGTPTRNLFIIL